jgi:hypothetical protein
MTIDFELRAVPILALVVVLAAAPLAARAGEGSKETFTGVAMPTGGVGTRASMQFTLYIESYCTDQERLALRTALVNGGQAGLLKALKKMKKGTIVVGPRTGYTIAAAISIPTEKGRRIIAVTERPITIPELWSGSRSTDYKFGFLAFDLEGKDGGSGQLILAAQLNVDKAGTLEIESYGVNPLRLMGVQQR